MVYPGCSNGGFDDVQDFHEQRVVLVRSLDERNENNTAKVGVLQSAKVEAGLQKQAGLNSGCGRRIQK